MVAGLNIKISIYHARIRENGIVLVDSNFSNVISICVASGFMIKHSVSCIQIKIGSNKNSVTNFYVLLAVHLGIILDNDQLDTQLFYFTIRLL